MLGNIRIVGVIIVLGFFLLPIRLWAAQVVPENTDVHLQPGQATEIVFEVLNDKTESQNYEVRLLSVESVEGGLQFYNMQRIEDLGLNISPISFSIESQASQEVKLTIAAGKDIQAGSQIVGVQVTEINNSNEGVGVQTGIVALVFLTLGDAGDQELKIVSFEPRSKMAAVLPIELFLELQNSGQAIVQPIGVIEVRNTFGKTIQTLNINPGQNRVLPNSNRILLIGWGDISPSNGFFEKMRAEFAQPRFGLYKFDLKLRANEESELLERQVRIILFPWRFSLALILAIGLVLGGLKFIQWSRSRV